MEEDYEIRAEFITQFPEPEEGRIYKVVKVELFKSRSKNLKGLRVLLEDVETRDLYATILWERERMRTTSKLGAFVIALGRRPKEWMGKIIKLKSWKRGERRLEVVTVRDSDTEEFIDKVKRCKNTILAKLELRRAYTIEETKANGVNWPENVIVAAWELLVEEGKASKIHTEPLTYLLLER